ncbi:unnamed protein product [Adineta ricciae]|uniref:Luciferase domain-containing protein n=1 Tax=Adineta ricciae TaxID=249248 RepID=A0A815ANN4_ADIRI|nr:unnamed protein product [Adineta ricciae]
MIFYVILSLLIAVLIFIKINYNRYAHGLREQPSYFLWFLTCVVNFQGWSKESYCLSTAHFKSNDQSGYLNEKDIPMRNQSRPKMLRALPHRQLSQQAPDDIMYLMHQYIESISIPRYGGVTTGDQLLLRGKSIVEYTGADGLFLPNADQNSFGRGEIAHLHSNDGSFHMLVHPSDAKLLIDKQWAERFPLAGMNLFNRITIPDTYILIYAPQNENEVAIWKTILTGAIKYSRDNRTAY